MPDPAATAHFRGAALKASYLCAAVAAGLLAMHYNTAIVPQWTRGLLLLSDGLALVGVALAVYSLRPEDWTDICRRPRQLAFGLNALLAVWFIAYVSVY